MVKCRGRPRHISLSSRDDPDGRRVSDREASRRLNQTMRDRPGDSRLRVDISVDFGLHGDLPIPGIGRWRQLIVFQYVGCLVGILGLVDNGCLL